MTDEADDLTRALDLFWLRSELAALSDDPTGESPVAGLRTVARRALLRAQTDGPDRPTTAEVERLIVLLMIDRIWTSGGKAVWEMDRARFQVTLDAHADQSAPYTLRFDVARPDLAPDGEGP